MPNSIDFRADQIQTKQIIVTGSGAGTTKLLIYGIEAQGSPVNEGVVNTTIFPTGSIGGDVFLYVSGAVNTKDSATVRGTSVFGGDLVVSGSLYNGSPAPAPAIRGIYSHAEGLSTFAIGSYSHAEGSGSNAYSIASHAEGRETIAYSGYSHAEGYLTRAENLYSHAEGYLTTGSGQASHAEGNTTKAIGFSSHAEGYQTIAFGTGSHASGYGTIASGSVDGAALSYTSILQTATGRFNARGNTTSLFVVGNGTGDADVSRKDLFSVDSINQEGIVKINGGISYKVGYLYYVPLSSIDYILTLNDYLVIVNVTDGGPFSVYLPASATTPLGTTYVIRRLDSSSTNNVQIYPDSTEPDIIITKNSIATSLIPLLLSGAGNAGGLVILTYIGQYTDTNYGTNFAWMTTTELDL